MIRNMTFFSRSINRLSMVLALLAIQGIVKAQTVNPPSPPGGGGSGGGNPDGPLDPLIPFDSTMNIIFLTLGVAFAVYVMIRRKKDQALPKQA